ncbi:MAG: hypothetical protein PVSMB5_24840 [Ktedonobacteraceae bacterium]
MCLRWSRARGREAAHSVEPHANSDEQHTRPVQLEDILTDEYDIEVELERKELLELLERALSALPEQIQQVLLKRYVKESSLAEIAAHLP